MIKVKNLSHGYIDGNNKNKVLDNINIEFEKGKVYTILGESGSGKTTLLSLISGLDKIQEGDILFKDKSIKKIGYDNYRLNYVNVVFQSFNLIKYLTGLQNIIVGMDICKIKPENKTKKQYALDILNTLNIDEETANRPVLKISGGERQRIAIARCIATNVDLILADEPTGNLDSKTEDKIIEIFKDLAHNENKCVIIVSHSQEVAKNADVVYRIQDGIIKNIEYKS